MTESTEKAMLEAGVEVGEALRRFSNMSELYERFLKKFLLDDNFQKIGEALEKDDIDGMLTAAHTLKGVAGNLGMKGLYNVCSDMVSLIRNGDPEGAKAVYPNLKESYDKVCGAVRYMEEMNG